MISVNSQISLTYTLRGESLISSGVYKSAEVNVFRQFTKDEVFKVNKSMQTIKQAVYSKAVCNVNLSTAFVKMALEIPKKPNDMNFHAWLRTPLGRAAQNWKKLSDEQKVEFHIEKYVSDIEGEEYSYKIL